MLKTIVLLNIFTDTMTHFFFFDEKPKHQPLFETNFIFFTVTFDKLNASLLKKSINFLKKNEQ